MATLRERFMTCCCPFPLCEHSTTHDRLCSALIKALFVKNGSWVKMCLNVVIFFQRKKLKTQHPDRCNQTDEDARRMGLRVSNKFGANTSKASNVEDTVFTPLRMRVIEMSFVGLKSRRSLWFSPNLEKIFSQRISPLPMGQGRW